MDSPNRLIIDGNNFLYRAYHVKGSKNFDNYINGINTAPIYRFFTMLKSVVNRFQPNEIVLTWDKRLTPVGSNFRKELVAYKEQRTNVDDHKAIHEYTSHIEPFTEALGIKTVYPNLMEADDVIRYFCEMDETTNMVLSSDKDLLQLVDSRNSIYMPSKTVIVTPENFEEVTTVKPEIYVLYKSIIGDVSDNISGLDKYGPVRAKKLAERLNMSLTDILNYSGDNVEKDLDLSKAQLEILQRNIKIMWLDYDHPELITETSSYKEQYENNKIQFDATKFRELCLKYKFFSFTREIGTWRQLFDKNNYSNCDLLSMISI